MGEMNDTEAIRVCRQWFAHMDRQAAKAKRLGELAAMARKGPAEAREAQRELGKIDRQPQVFDGAYLRPAVEHLIKQLEAAAEDIHGRTEGTG